MTVCVNRYIEAAGEILTVSLLLLEDKQSGFEY